MKVLLVDDEKKFAMMLSKRLVLRGIDVNYVYTGEEALVMVENSRYDVAILDVKMPGIGGIELKRKLSGLALGMKLNKN
jgi:DNA-binding response OmpR family regulator